MAWGIGSLALCYGWGIRVVNAVLSTALTASEGSIFSISTTVSRSDGASMRINKTSSNITGQLYRSGLTATANQGSTIIFGIATGWTSGKTMILFPGVGGLYGLGDIGIRNDGGTYKLGIYSLSATPVWEGSFGLTVSNTAGVPDQWYAINICHLNPTPGSNSLYWQHSYQIMEAGSTTVEERSPWINVGQGGVSYSTIDSFGISLAEGGGGSTVETPDIFIDGFAVVTGGVFGPADIKFETVVPSADGTDAGWTEVGDGDGAKWDELIPAYAGGDDDDTTYISGTTTPYSAAHAGFTALTGSDEEFALQGYFRGRVTVAGGVVNGRMRSGTATVSGSLLALSATSYAWGFTQPFVRSTLTSPQGLGGDGGSPWTTALMDAAEWGVASFLGTASNKRCTGLALQRMFGLPFQDTDPVNGMTTMRELDPAFTGHTASRRVREAT